MLLDQFDASHIEVTEVRKVSLLDGLQHTQRGITVFECTKEVKLLEVMAVA